MAAKGDAVPLAVDQWYDFHEFGCHLGNVGLDVTADLQRRSISVSMKVKAPEDRRSTKARATWLIRQLPADAAPDVHVRIFWPGRAVATQHTADAIRADPSVAVAAHPGVVASSFELLLVRNLGARFGSRKRFIVELETAVPDFYEQVGQHLKAWRPRAPQIRDDASEPADVEPSALQQKADEAALTRDSWRGHVPALRNLDDDGADVD